eukprot:TRINITY_DN4993_c0_g1_i1.p1 TRINITY_DN4993_c0_g1~~TRINITY_DN4993_c0_g1_i1.p1  ORF type:complete len:913 (+),score=195.12 TRINITY_DN4993_c0_g1_i1:52-2739(+)
MTHNGKVHQLNYEVEKIRTGRGRQVASTINRVSSRDKRRVRSGSAGSSTKTGLTGTVRNGKKAVLIGVSYKGQKKEVRTATSHTAELSSVITGIGFKGEQWVLTDDQPRMKPTRQNIIQALRWLVEGSYPGDALIFSFIGLSGYVNQVTKQHGILPSDHLREGMISEGEIRNILNDLPPGVRLTLLCDAGFGGTFMNLPFKIWAEDSGVGVRGEPTALPATTELLLLSAARDERSFELGVGSPGNLLPSFTSAVRAAGSIETISYKTLLINIKSELKKRKCSLAPQFSANSKFDFEALCTLSAPYTPAASPPPNKEFTPASYQESALHQAAAMGWLPGNGPPMPPEYLRSPSPKRDRKGMSVRVTAPEGCKIDLQCEPLNGATPTRTVHVPVPAPVPTLMPMHSVSPESRSPSVGLNGWEVNSMHKELPMPPSTGGSNMVMSTGNELSEKEPHPHSPPAHVAEREKVYRLRRKRSPSAKAVPYETNLVASRRREREIELGQLERYKRHVQETKHERELRRQIEAGEQEELHQEIYMRRLQKHAERVHEYSKNLPKKKKVVVEPQSPVQDDTVYFSPERVSPAAPEQPMSPGHRSVAKKVFKQAKQLNVMNGQTSDLLDRHMLQRRALEEQLERLQGDRSVSATLTAASERSATPELRELSNAYAQTVTDPAKKDALRLLIKQLEHSTPLKHGEHLSSNGLPPRSQRSPSPVHVDRGSQVTASDLLKMDRQLIREYWKLLKKYAPFKKVQRIRKTDSVLASPSPEVVRPATPPALAAEDSPVHPVAAEPEPEPELAEEGEWVWNEETQDYDWVVPEAAAEEPADGEWVWNETTQDYDWVQATAEAEEPAGEWVWNEDTQDYDWVTPEPEPSTTEHQETAGEWVWNDATQDYDWVVQ